MARVVAALDREEDLAFLPLQDELAASLLEGMPERARMATWRLALPDGTLVERGRGGVVLLRTMRRTRLAGRLLDALPDRVVDSTYRFVARHRSRLGRLVPDRPGPHRFP